MLIYFNDIMILTILLDDLIYLIYIHEFFKLDILLLNLFYGIFYVCVICDNFLNTALYK